MTPPFSIQRFSRIQLKMDYATLIYFGLAALFINIIIGLYAGYMSFYTVSVLSATILFLIAALVLYNHNFKKTAHILSRIVFNVLMLVLSFNFGLRSAVFMYYIPFTIGSIYFLRDAVSQKQVTWYCITCLVFILIIVFFCPVNPSAGISQNQGDLLLKLNSLNSFILSSIFLHIIFSHLITQNIALKKQKAFAEEMGNAKEKFLSVMSHELRTPLNGIIGAIELIQKEKDIDIKEQYTGVLKQSSDHMLKLVNDILDYNKLVVHKMEIKTIRCDIRQLTQHIFSTFAAGFESKGIGFHFHFDNVLENDAYFIDDVRLTQVLSNLLSNALKYTDKGKVDFTVKCIARQGDESTVYFEVKDTGIGIPESRRQYVFETYNQSLNVEKRFTQSTGLGLSISKQLINLMQGKIDFTSKENAGTNFFFTLSLLKAKQVSPVLKHLTNTNFINIPENLNFKVLIAEDNPINMMIAKRMLVQKQVEVHEATNGREVLQHLQSAVEPFHLLLLDLQLPLMSGMEVMAWIKENNLSLPVIAFTANLVDKHDFKKLKLSGFTDVLPKPFQSEELYDKILRHARTEAFN